MKHKILALILLVCLVVSGIMAFIPTDQICWVQSGCEEVQNSKYHSIKGIEISYLGVVAFFILLSLTISHIRTPRKYKQFLIFVGVILGSVIGAYFLYLQVFVIKAFCPYCVVVDIGIILGLVILLHRRKKTKWKKMS